MISECSQLQEHLRSVTAQKNLNGLKSHKSCIKETGRVFPKYDKTENIYDNTSSEAERNFSELSVTKV